jgi:hypothetical protein
MTMKLLLVAAVAIVALASYSEALFLGQGGVYNSPAANEYWNER